MLLVLFLGDLRAALTVALILPLAALATFILMRQFGLSANLMSWAGWPSPSACWWTPPWSWWRTSSPQLGRGATDTRAPAAAAPHLPRHPGGALPVASGILIIVIVFLPLLTLQGLEGKLFVPVALTIVFALAQLLAAVADRDPGAGLLSAWPRRSTASPGSCASSRRIYGPSLAWGLRHANGW